MTVHRGLGFELPAAIARLHAFMAADRARSWYARRSRTVEHALGAGTAKWVGTRDSADLAAAAEADELRYTGHPFEIVPFAWQGADALQYAMLVHAEELAPRGPIVSFAPSDHSGPVWLGDDAGQALANLMGVALRHARTHYSSRDDREYLARSVAAIRTLGRTLHIAPSRRIEVPKGWRWVADRRNMGTLAPKALFDPALGKHVHADWPTAETELARARASLKRGFPASALAIARHVYSDCYDEGTLAAAEVMREAYAAMGRQFLVARVDAYLAVKKDDFEKEKRQAARRRAKKRTRS
jgi:hypothetical protein